MLYKLLSLFTFPIVMLVLPHLFSHKTYYLYSVEIQKVEIMVMGKNVWKHFCTWNLYTVKVNFPLCLIN
jgi:hypothetical protein